jgi:hypothetical protein
VVQIHSPRPIFSITCRILELSEQPSWFFPGWSTVKHHPDPLQGAVKTMTSANTFAFLPNSLGNADRESHSCL